VSAVIFDLDGVLVESEPFWQRALADTANCWLDDAGSTRERYTAADLARFEGGRVDETLSDLLDELRADLGDPVDGDDLVTRTIGPLVERVVADFSRDPAPIRASVAVARDLHARGTALAVASSSSPVFIDAALDAIGLSEAFGVRRSALHLEQGKPHPQVYLDAASALGERPEDCVAIEDSARGVEAAGAAHMPCIGLWRHEDDPPAAFDTCARVTGELTVDDVDIVLKGEQ